MLVRWLKDFIHGCKETKQFMITVLILFIIVIGTLIFAYARLDTARSTGPQEKKKLESLQN